MTRDVGRTDDGRFVVVDGRRWRTADPALPGDIRARLLHHLGVARSGVRTAGSGVPAKGGAMDGPGPVLSGGMVYVLSGYVSLIGRPGNVLLAFGVD